MDNLDETEKYASAALFTLALYSSQVEVGVDRFQEISIGEYRPSTWGCPQELDLDDVLFGENLKSEDLTHFWGWDCCGVNGLCQSVYQNLKIPRKSWTGLLKIPETVGDVSTDRGIEDLIVIVERYSQMLDPELRYTKGKAVEYFSLQRRRSIDIGDLDVVAAGAIPEIEENQPKQGRSQDSPGKKLPGISEDKESDDAPLLESEGTGVSTTKWPETLPDSNEEADLRTRVSVFAQADQCPFEEAGNGSDGEASPTYEDYVESLRQPEDFVVDENEDVVIPKAGFTPRNDYTHQASGASCLALRGMIKAAILENALLQQEDQAEDLKTRIQWYDARCRIALMRMAHWLRIPYSTMAAFETETAISMLKLKADEAVDKKSTTLSRWLKISAMAIGGGAAVAITGGLAAPAVAAGLGAAVTLAGGGAAAATAVTGFAASTAGTATITTAFGAFGAHSTGATMYKRTGEVKEFAFWDLSMDWNRELEKKKVAKAAKSSSNFWPWKKTETSPPSRSRSQSMTQISDLDRGHEGYVALTETPTEPSTPDSITLDGYKEKNRKVEVVPGIEVDPDDLEVTKSTSNYSEWWDAMIRAKERPDLFPLPVNNYSDNLNLSLTIAVSGMISNDKHFVDPWRRLPSTSCDRFSVIWESKLLKKVNDAIIGLITSQVANETAKWFIKKYLYTGLLSAVAIPVLITTLVDVTVGNSWALAMERSVKAGELLAQYLLQGLHGHRPVTLIGYSLGARCIFRCLLTLYKAGKRGVVENVILLGAPVSLTDYKWARARSVVAGRFVNGYSTRDWVLGIIFRIGRGVLQNVAGISPVSVPGIESIDLSSIVSGQTEYAACMKDILAALNM